MSKIQSPAQDAPTVQAKVVPFSLSANLRKKEHLMVAKVVYNHDGFPGAPITFKIEYMDKKTTRELTKKHTTTRYNNGVKEEHHDEKAFIEEFVKMKVRGWENFTIGKLKMLVAFESDLPDDAEFPFTPDNAFTLVDYAWEVFGFLQDASTTLKHFIKGDPETERKN